MVLVYKMNSWMTEWYQTEKCLHQCFPLLKYQERFHFLSSCQRLTECSYSCFNVHLYYLMIYMLFSESRSKHWSAPKLKHFPQQSFTFISSEKNKQTRTINTYMINQKVFYSSFHVSRQTEFDVNRTAQTHTDRQGTICHDVYHADFHIPCCFCCVKWFKWNTL